MLLNVNTILFGLKLIITGLPRKNIFGSILYCTRKSSIKKNPYKTSELGIQKHRDNGNVLRFCDTPKLKVGYESDSVSIKVT